MERHDVKMNKEWGEKKSVDKHEETINQKA